MPNATDTPQEAAGAVYTPHPYAEIFPPMYGEAFAALVADIKTNGLRERITVNARNQILDGANRYRACMEAGVEPQFERREISDKEVLAFIISRNLHRRHLTTAQKAAAAAAAVRLSKDGPANLRLSQATAAKLFNVSERAVHEALSVLERSPELHEAAIAGQVSTHMSSEIAALPQAPRDDALKKLKDGNKKGAKAIANAAASPQGKKAPVARRTRQMTVASKNANSRFKGNAVYAPLFAELDQLADNLSAYPLAPSAAQQLIAELRRAIEQIENTIKE